MTDLSTATRPYGRTAVRDTPIVRLRCAPCEVAWTGEPHSACWVCGAPGLSLNRLLVRHDRAVDALEEFDLLR